MSPTTSVPTSSSQPWRRHVPGRHGIIGRRLRPRRTNPRGHGSRRRRHQRRRPARRVCHQLLERGGRAFHQPGRGPISRTRTRTSGLWHDSVLWVGWGCALADFDNDGWPDCFVANGHIDNNLERLGYGTPYAEPALLHRNMDGKRFLLATRKAGPYFDSDHVGRGVAYGDMDNDGDIDLVVNHKDAPPAVLRNDTPTRQSLDSPRPARDSQQSRRDRSPNRGRSRGPDHPSPAQGGSKSRVRPRPPAVDRGGAAMSAVA